MKYQQGDVILKKIKKDLGNAPNTIKPSNNKAILALGEATGHHHRFELNELPQDASIIVYGSRFRQNNPDYVEIINTNATLYHEEHNPITIEPGFYSVNIVREFDHIGGVTRKVAD